MKSSIKLLIVISFLTCVNSLNAQTVDEIIARHLKARGGTEALKSVGAIQFIGKIETAGMNLKMLFVEELPDKMRFQVDMNGTPGVTVFTADSGWIFDPSQGHYEPTKLSKQEVELKKPLISHLMVFFDDLLLNYKEKSLQVSFIGRDTVAGKTAYKLLVMLKDGTVITYYIDTRDFLDYHHKVLFPDLNVIFDIELSNFALVEGLNIPLNIESKIKNQSMTKISVETIKINPDLNKEYFKMPEF